MTKEQLKNEGIESMIATYKKEYPSFINDLRGDKHKNVTWSFRYINPDANIRLAAGRALLTNDGESAFQAGASASITGNMLTTVACATIRSDRRLLEDLGRDVTPEYWKEEKSEA